MTGSPLPRGARAVAWPDLAFALAVIATAGLVWFGTADLPPPRYEPIGSAALPRAIAALMALLAVLVAVRAVRTPAAPQGSSVGWGATLRALLLAALLLAFVSVMDARLVGFRPAAAAFLFCAGLTLGGIGVRRVAAFALFAVGLSLGIHALFTRLFYIDLP